MRVLAIDPSGNWSEGNGITGWAVLDGEDDQDFEIVRFGHIRAKDFKKPEAYWDAVARLLFHNGILDYVVYETYRLQHGKALQQTWSELETPQLIGIIRHECWYSSIVCVGQNPSIKSRFPDSLLVETGIAQLRKGRHYIKGHKTNDHERDAIRHGLYFLRYGRKGGK